MTLSLLGVVLLGAGAVTAVTLASGDEQKQQEKAGPLLPLAPGEGTPARYGPVEARNACQMIPVEFLVQQGFTLEGDSDIWERLPDPHTSVEPVTQEPGSMFMGLSSCAVFFADGGRVDIDIKRPPYNTSEEIAKTIEMYEEDGQPPYTEHGWEIYLLPDEDDPKWVDGALRKGDTVVQTLFGNSSNLPDGRSQDLAKQVLSRIAAALEQPPAPPNVATYPAPYGRVPDPCEALTAEDLSSMVGLPDSGVIEREWTVGEVRLLDRGMAQTGRFVETKCRRTSQQRDLFDDVGGLGLTLQTFRDERIAGMALDQYLDPAAKVSVFGGPARTLPETVGDSQALAVTRLDQESTYLFRVGRHLVHFQDAKMDDAALSAKYSAVAKAVAERLRTL
ncbi:hypothetical protein [Saccharopolyspora cebuensis]|uniref:hypothetical protein n=1 Tax=Saccharopolyspora cebuensis TaxID=418759 RepID=UPI0031EBEF09